VITDGDLRRGEIWARYVGNLDQEEPTAAERRRSRKPEPVEEKEDEDLDIDEI
jgi:hypothetical protein